MYGLKPIGQQPIAVQVSNLLNLSLKSYATSGSGIKYSFRKFLEYITSTEYSTTDIFLVNLSSPERYYDYFSDSHLLSYGNNVDRRITELERQLKNEKDNVARRVLEEKIFHLKQNKDGINWYLANATMYDSFPYDMIGFLSFMKSFCASSNNKLVVVNGFRLDFDRVDDFYKKYFTNTQNFLFLYIEEGLFRLSVNEFKNTTINWEDEVRANHFCPENRTIIANMLADIYKTCDVSNFDETKLHSGLFDNMDDIVKKYNYTQHRKAGYSL
jgi:hypothetical protein